MEVDLTLQVIKFSEAYGEIGGIHWSHIHGLDLMLKLQGYRERGPLRLVILHGNKIEENIDLAEYLMKADSMLQHVVPPFMDVRPDKLPIFGIFKEAVLALRYRLRDQPRRIQMRFEDAGKCQEVVAVLKRRGLQFENPPRPTTARQDTELARPETALLDNRHLLPRSESPSSQKTSKTNPFHLPNIEAGSLSHRSVFRANETAHVYGSYMAPTPVTLPQRQQPSSNTEVCDISGQLRYSSSTEEHSGTTVPAASVNVDRSDSSVPCPTQSPSRGSGSGGSRPGSATLALPPLPKPKIIEKRPCSPLRMRPASSSCEYMSAHHSSETQQQELSHPGTDVRLTSEHENKSTSDTASPQTLRSACGSGHVTQKANPMQELLYTNRSTFPPAQAGHEAAGRMTSMTDAPHESESPQSAVQPSTMDDRGLQVLDDEERLARFLAQTSEDRQTALEQFMIENLENPIFTTLCEDVEACWRRIVLGL